MNLAPSRATQRELEEHGIRAVGLWSRGVDAQRFHPRRASAAMRERLTSGDTEAPLLLYVGRLSPEKRVEWLRAVVRALPHVRLAVVGDGPSRASLESLFAGTPAAFTGYLTGDDLAAACASADLFVFPGANETFGNVALEAMASGLPVIAPRAGGVLDHVVDGRTGVLFEPDDLGSLVMAARWLVHDASFARRLGQAAGARARERTWESELDRLLDVYRDVLGRTVVGRAA